MARPQPGTAGGFGRCLSHGDSYRRFDQCGTNANKRNMLNVGLRPESTTSRPATIRVLLTTKTDYMYWQSMRRKPDNGSRVGYAIPTHTHHGSCATRQLFQLVTLQTVDLLFVWSECVTIRLL